MMSKCNYSIVTYSGFSIHGGTLLHSKSQHTTVKHSRKLFEHTYTSDQYGLGTLTPIEFFQQDLLWQSSNTHSNSCSPLSASLTTGIVRPEPNCKTHCRRRCLTLRQSRIPQRRCSRHGFSCFQPSATSLSLVLFVQEPSLKLLPLDTRHLYSSQACFQRLSSWPAHMSFRSS
jgi:hypothetical protein